MIERTSIGLQHVIPGAAKATDKKMAQRAADKPLRAKVAQRQPEGLFSDDRNQLSLWDRGYTF